MADMTGAIRNTVSITQFNRGFAGKIFEEVKRAGAKVVMKNNAAECVLLSPEEYVRMVDEVNDARLLAMATERMEKADLSKAIPAEEMYARLGITRDDIDACEDVEIE